MPDWIRPSEAIAFDNRPTSVSLYTPYLRLVLTSKSSRNIRDVALRELMLDPNTDNPSRLGGGFILGRGPDSGRAPKELSSRVISRQHVQLLVDKDGAVFLVDLNSTHGTIVRRGTDSTKVHGKQPVRLLDGDQVTIGRPVLSGNLHDAVRFKVVFRHEVPAATRLSCPYMASFFATSKDVPAIDAALYPKPTGPVPNMAGRYGLEPSMLYESEPESLLPRGGSDSPAKNAEVINVVDDSDDPGSSSDDDEDDDVQHLPPAEQSSPPTSVDSHDKSDEADESAFDPEITICIPSSIVEYESQDNADADDDDDEDETQESERRPSQEPSDNSAAPKHRIYEDYKGKDVKKEDDPAEDQHDAPTNDEDMEHEVEECGKIQLPSLKESILLPPRMVGSLTLPNLSRTSRELPFPAVFDLATDSVISSDEARRWSRLNLDSASSADPDSVMMSFIAEPAPAQAPFSTAYDEDEEYESWLAGEGSRSSSQDAEENRGMGSDYPEDEDEHEHDCDECGCDDEDDAESASDHESVASESHDVYGTAIELGPTYEPAYEEDATSELSDPQSAMSEDEDAHDSEAEEDASDDGVSDRGEDVAIDSEQEEEEDSEAESDSDDESEHEDEHMSEDEQDQSEDEGLPKMSAISELKLDGSTPSKTSSTTTDPHPMLGLSYLSDLHDLDFSAGSDFEPGTDSGRNVTFSGDVDYDFTCKAPKTETQVQATQSSTTSKLPPSPANSADGSNLNKASQTPETKSSVLPSVGLATPPSPLPRQLTVEASAQTSSPRKRSHEEMEETSSSLIDLSEAASSTTTSAAGSKIMATAPAPESPRPRKRRLLERFGFTAGLVVGAAGMFGTLLLLGEE